MSKKRKLRTEFRRNREVRTRDNDLTDRYDSEDRGEDLAEDRGERVRAKGKFSRKRTVAGAEVVEDDTGTVVLPEVDTTQCSLGRVLRVQGLVSLVEDDRGVIFRCATRRLLKSLSTDQRHVVAAGDRVWFRPADAAYSETTAADSSDKQPEGMIERVEPRRGVLSRTSKGRQHVIVTHVDQLVIVTSAAEPRIKPNLIDRLLVTAERARIRPLICINKIDLIDPVELMPLVGVYSRLGYRVVMTSAEAGSGIAALRNHLAGQQSVVTGQSGVGKSSLLNAVEPGLARKVQTVSRDSQKGRHTTTTSELVRLNIDTTSIPSYVVDTPGIRQFELWDVIPEEVAGYFRELRPFVSGCRYPDCTHTHEAECAVKDAVADGWVDTRRYESYMQIRETG